MIRFAFNHQAVRDLLSLGAELPEVCERVSRELLAYRSDPESVARREPNGVGLRHCVLLEVDAGSAYGIPLAAQVVLQPIPEAEILVLAAAPQPGRPRVGSAELLANQRRWSSRPLPLAPPAIPLAPLGGAEGVLRHPNVALALARAKDRAMTREFGAGAEFRWRTVRVGEGGDDRAEEGALDVLTCAIFKHVLIVSMASAGDRMAKEELAHQIWRAHRGWLRVLAQVLVPSRGADIVGAPPLPE